VEQDGLIVTRLIGNLPLSDHWSPSYRPEAAALIRHYLLHAQPDIVHVQHWPRLTCNLVALCKSLELPTVITLHDLWATCARGNRLRWDRHFCTDPVPIAPCLSCVIRRDGEDDGQIAKELDVRQRLVADELRRADRILVPSEAQRSLLARLLHPMDTELHVLTNGTIRRFNRLPAPDRTDQPLRAGYWGTLSWWKGPHLLLEALGHLPDPSAVEVHLYGLSTDPSYGEQLQALAARRRVVFHGSFSPADLQYSELHLAVFPSLCHESHSFVLDEAFQLGLPVVVPDRGAPSARLGTAGLTFKSGDVKDLARQIQRLLEEPDLLERLGNGTPAVHPVAIEAHVDQLELIYRRLIDAAQPSFG
jgi:glycosyltransferase involved in cell wall biosynthesis